ncbi:hypothetical protein NX059_009186 [Plenodomus lindquistii]|nr:hypothetical protein NX059_009186 [Plenodomus lindquistii]
MSSWCFPPLRRTAHHNHTLRGPTPVEFRVRLCDNEDASRVAILTYDTASVPNVISRRLVTKVLGETAHPIEKGSSKPIRTQVHGEEVDGYVDLDWCRDANSESWHNTRFLVTTTSNPPYDAVLGRKDAESYGMVPSRSKR